MKDIDEPGERSGSRAVWVLVILAALAIPILLLGSLAVFFVRARERDVQTARLHELRAQEEALLAQAAARAVAQSREMERRALELGGGGGESSGSASMSGLHPNDAFVGGPGAGAGRAAIYSRNMVLIRAVFEGFPTQTAYGLVVWTAREPGPGESMIVAPAAPFQEITGRINGQTVTRRPIRIEVQPLMTIADAGPGGMGAGMGSAVGGMPAGGAAMGSGAGGVSGSFGGAPGAFFSLTTDSLESNAALHKIGLVALRVRERALEPVQIVGDLPEARLGEPLHRITAPNEPELVVSRVGTPIEVQGRNVRPGEILFNASDQPVALVSVANHTPATRSDGIISHAVALADLFEAARTLHESQNLTAESPPADPAVDESTLDAERQIDREIRSLVAGVAAASPDERQARQAELRTKLEQRFELVQSRRQSELENLQKRLETLRASHTDRAAKKAEAIEQELESLLPKKP